MARVDPEVRREHELLMSLPLFLLGAGFNADAKAEVGPVYGNSIYIGRHEIDCGYPLVADLWQLCFGVANPPEGVSIESCFAEALSARNFEPMAQLAEAIMKAGYHLATHLRSNERGTNSYAAFFRRFASCTFLTFNYDSLVEIFLSQYGIWYPYDGFG
ncbi:MAG TPA: hypothetical protein VF179_14135, partial [Thermoanaerobaculia bacterium]|nr:hypothetical protein [Thermoanaerobaculia bacterium]